jgi:hypothetical protein
LLLNFHSIIKIDKEIITERNNTSKLVYTFLLLYVLF